MKKCTGTDRDWRWCRVEKMGCPGCDHYKEKERNEEDEQKISERTESKSN